MLVMINSDNFLKRSLMQTDKAYKILASNHNLSHKQAKSLIDSGLVMLNGKKLNIARLEVPYSSKFEILEVHKPHILFENDDLLAIDKPAFIESHALAKMFEGWSLLHRLDQETSGVILLIKEQSAFHNKAKEAFKRNEVYKEYRCLAQGIIAQPMDIDTPISTSKKRGFARSRIDKQGLESFTQITPIGIVGKKTLLKVVIKTGRTHQIRVHLQSIQHPIIGDRIYAKDYTAKRLMLHAHKIALLGIEITSPLPPNFYL